MYLRQSVIVALCLALMAACSTSTTPQTTGQVSGTNPRTATAPYNNAKPLGFKTMTSPCDCLSLSRWGQTMKDNHVYTIAGGGNSTPDNVLGTAAQMSSSTPSPIFDQQGNLFFVDELNHKIHFLSRNGGTVFGRSSTTANYVYTVAGTGSAGNSADGTTATSAQLTLTHPFLAFDSNGTLFATVQNKVRAINGSDATVTAFGVTMQPGKIYDVMGGLGYYPSGSDNVATVYLANPSGLAFDSTGNLYVGSYDGHRVNCLCKTSGTYYGISMTAGRVYTVAGSGTAGFSGNGGAATSANLQYVDGIAIDSSDNLFIADAGNSAVRMVARNTGTVFGASRTQGYIYSIAGSGGTHDYDGDGGLASSSKLNTPRGLAFDSAGNLAIADSGNKRVRFVARTTTSSPLFGQDMTANYIYTICGTNADDRYAIPVSGTEQHRGVAFDSSGDLYLGTSRIRIVPDCR